MWIESLYNAINQEEVWGGVRAVFFYFLLQFMHFAKGT